MKAERLVIGLALLVAGFIWIMVNIGVIPARTALEFWRFWPLLLIIWGILLLFGRSGGGTGCLIPLLILLVIAGAFFTFSFNFYQGPSLTVVESGFNLPKGAEETLELDLIHHAGEFTLTSETQPQSLLSAMFEGYAEPQINHSTTDNMTRVNISDISPPNYLRNQFSRWALHLDPEVRALVSLRTGATKAKIDLSDLRVENLDIKAGAGDLTVYLGVHDANVSIESGASSIVIYVPVDTGIRLQVRGALVNVRGENAGIVNMGDRFYVSRELEEKTAVVELNITAGAGSITIRPAPAGISF